MLASPLSIYRILPSLIRHRTPGALDLGFESEVVLVDWHRRHAGELVLPGLCREDLWSMSNEV